MKNYKTEIFIQFFLKAQNYSLNKKETDGMFFFSILIFQGRLLGDYPRQISTDFSTDYNRFFFYLF